MSSKRKPNTYNIKARLALPFRCEVEPFEVTGILPGDSWKTSFRLYYQEAITIPRSSGQPSVSINTNLCTFIQVDTALSHREAIDGAFAWARDDPAQLLSDHVLPKVNHLLLHLKHAKPEVVQTSAIRTIGDVDLVYCHLRFEGRAILSRGTSTFFAGGGFLVNPFSVQLDISDELPKEWVVLTQAVDLVNHGHFLEGLVVGFALLDDLAQDFLKTRLPNIGGKEANALLRQIETARVKTYLGTLTRMACGQSPLDDERLTTELNWLNDKRNKVMHAGETCTREEAQRALTAALDLLNALNNLGAEFHLPSSLGFWTP